MVLNKYVLVKFHHTIIMGMSLNHFCIRHDDNGVESDRSVIIRCISIFSVARCLYSFIRVGLRGASRMEQATSFLEADGFGRGL